MGLWWIRQTGSKIALIWSFHRKWQNVVISTKPLSWKLLTQSPKASENRICTASWNREHTMLCAFARKRRDERKSSTLSLWLQQTYFWYEFVLLKKTSAVVSSCLFTHEQRKWSDIATLTNQLTVQAPKVAGRSWARSQSSDHACLRSETRSHCLNSNANILGQLVRGLHIIGVKM